MIKLCGIAASNYYNKVKLAMVEKGVAFDESEVWPIPTPELLAKSPLGKIPYMETADGVLIESQVLMNYIESLHPQPALMPANPFAQARVNEVLTFLELHLELVVRELYAEAYFGAKVSDNTKARVKDKLAKNIAAFAGLPTYSPFIAGDMFSMADCAAIMHFPAISGATLAIYGEDMLAGLPVADYLQRMGERPSVQRVFAERTAFMPKFAAVLKR